MTLGRESGDNRGEQGLRVGSLQPIWLEVQKLGVRTRSVYSSAVTIIETTSFVSSCDKMLFISREPSLNGPRVFLSRSAILFFAYCGPRRTVILQFSFLSAATQSSEISICDQQWLMKFAPNLQSSINSKTRIKTVAQQSLGDHTPISSLPPCLFFISSDS